MKKRVHIDRGAGRMRKLRLERARRRDHDEPQTMNSKALVDAAAAAIAYLRRNQTPVAN
jgi:hypothetical protein